MGEGEAAKPWDIDSGIDRMCSKEELRNRLIARSPIASIVIGGVMANCILDTGAETSLISSTFYDTFLAGKTNRLGAVGKLLRLFGANDLEIAIRGYLETSIQVFDISVKASFLVRADHDGEADNERRREFPIIIGCNILRTISTLGVTPSGPSKEEWLVALNWFESHGTSGVGTSHKVSGMYTVQDETIPPDTAKLITCQMEEPLVEPHSKCVLLQKCSLEKSKNGSTYTTCESLRSNASTVDTVLEMQLEILEGMQHAADSVQLLVSNNSSVPVVLPARCKVALATEVELVDEIYLQESGEGFQVSIERVVVNEVDILEPKSCVGYGSEDHDKDDTDGSDISREKFTFPDGTMYELPPGVTLNDFGNDEALQVAKLIRQYDAAFAKGSFDLGACDRIPHEIRLTSEKPVNLPYRRVAPHVVPEVKKLLQDLLDRTIIKKSSSPYASPVVLVQKRDGSIRLCIDYRKVNSLTVKDAFPLPRIEETLEILAGSKFFSSLDLAHGSFQVTMHPGLVDKTAFRVPWGPFAFNRMPQGLCNSPGTFQRVMELMFGDLNLSQLVLYLDDILVYSETFEDHLSRLGTVFERLISHGLKLKGCKCRFFQKEVKHLGHVVNSHGVSVDPDKVSRVANWPVLKCGDELRAGVILSTVYTKVLNSCSPFACIDTQG